MRGDRDTFQQLLPHITDINAVGHDLGYYSTLLHAACRSDQNLAIVNDLLDEGAILQLDKWGVSPLHIAARHGCVDVVRTLVTRGPDRRSWLHACDYYPYLRTNGETALTYAVIRGHLDLVEILLKAEADTFYPGREMTPKGWVRLSNDHPSRIPPAHLACYANQLSVLRYFIEELGMSVNSRTAGVKDFMLVYPTQDTISAPEHLYGNPKAKACRFTQLTLLHFTLARNPELNVQCAWECMEYLLDQGADIFIRSGELIPSSAPRRNASSPFKSTVTKTGKSVIDIVWEYDLGFTELVAPMASRWKEPRPPSFYNRRNLPGDSIGYGPESGDIGLAGVIVKRLSNYQQSSNHGVSLLQSYMHAVQAFEILSRNDF